MSGTDVLPEEIEFRNPGQSPISIRWRDWRFGVGVALATVACCFFLTFEAPQLFGVHQWLTLGDARWTVQSAQYVSFGGLGTVYSINAEFLPLPGFLLLLAPAVALGNHLNYVNSFPIALPYPSMWIVAAPVFFVSGATAILGADYLADTLGVCRSRRRLIAIFVGLFLVVPTVCWAGHPEDMLALALTCVSTALLLRGRFVGSAVVLSLAIMMQSWAILLVPLLLVASPPGRRLRSLVYSSTVPAFTGLLLLAEDFHDAFRSLVIQPMQGDGQHLPWWGLAHQMTINQGGATDVVRVGSSSRSFAVLVAIVLPLLFRRNIRPSTVMLITSVVLVARDASETQVWCYYLAPAAAFLLLGVAAGSGWNRRKWILGGLASGGFYAFAAAGYAAYSLPTFLALGIILLTAAVALGAGHRRGYGHHEHERAEGFTAVPVPGQTEWAPSGAFVA